MTATWPSDLPQYVQADSYAERYGSTVVRSSVDVGQAKVRARYTARVDTFDVSLKLTTTQLGVFEDFFVTTISGGATQFTWRHPRKGTPAECRVIGEPSVSFMDGIYRVTFALEVLP